METVFSILTLALALTGIGFGFRSFYNFWKIRSALRRRYSGHLGWPKEAKSAPEYRLMYHNLWMFFAWTFGTIIAVNIVLVPLRNWLF